MLDELGLGSLPESEKGALLTHIYETLEMRVGMRLADQMTNEQLDEFEKYFEAKDDAGAFHWLETNFPNYKEIVQDEFNKLKEEVRLSAPEILRATSQGAPAGAMPPQDVPQPAADPQQPQPFFGSPSAPQPPAPNNYQSNGFTPPPGQPPASPPPPPPSPQPPQFPGA